MGPRPARQCANGIEVLATPEEAEAIADGDLVVPPGSKHPDSAPYAFRVIGRDEPREAGGDGAREFRRGTYVPLLLDVPSEPFPAEDAPSVGAPAPAPVEQPEKPLVDPALWRSKEQWQRMQQSTRWDDAKRRLSERQMARALETIFMEVLWDGLDTEQREKALKGVHEDREWPGLFERLEAEERERRERDRKDREAAAAKADRERKARERREAQEAKKRAAQEKADREREEREEREAAEERARRAEEERARLQRERDELVAS